MYPNSPTETELLLQLIESGSPDITDIIQDYIDTHDTLKMREGVKYYFNKSEIKSRKKYYYDKAGNKIEDQEAINNKIPHGWHKLLVDQKVSYLVGQELTITSEKKEFEVKLNELLGDEFDDVLPELVKSASNKGREWLHPYIDEEGNFDYIVIPAEEVIPIHNNSKRKNIEAVIRYYLLDDETLKIELWDRDQVTYYEKVNGQIVLDVSEEVNPAPHFFVGEEGAGWGEVPFIEFANNEEREPDLTFYKELIDAYDKVISGTTDNMEEIQSLVYVLKGYEGTNLAEFMEQLRYYKAIKVSEDGGVDTEQAEVPMEAVEKFLDRFEGNIFTFGQGVNTNTDKFGNSPSGVALKFLFSLLDMKSNVLERKFTKGLMWLVWYIAEYLRITSQGEYDYKTAKFTFNKSMLMNEMENAQIAQNSSGIISKKTIVANHPWTTDIEEEMKELEKEAEAYSLPDIEDEDDEESTTD
jgi:SPP1 family phage portal protein